MKLEERLEKMVDKSFIYNGFEYKVISFKVSGEEVTIVTNKAWKTFPITKINAELGKFLPIEPENQKTEAVVLSTVNQNKEVLSKTIIENIEKIKNNAAYIPQAKAVNEQIKTMIAMAKVELDIIKLKEKVR